MSFEPSPHGTPRGLIPVYTPSTSPGTGTVPPPRTGPRSPHTVPDPLPVLRLWPRHLKLDGGKFWGKVCYAKSSELCYLEPWRLHNESQSRGAMAAARGPVTEPSQCCRVMAP